MKDSEKTRSSTTECVLTTSIWRHQHRLSCCMHAPAHYVLGIRETLVALVVRRVPKSDVLRRSRFVSCVRTQGHMTACLFVLTCLHVECTNKNLGNERVTTFVRKVRKFMKREDIPEARWCLEWPRDVFICYADIHTCVRAHENLPNSLTKGAFLGSPQNRWTSIFKHADGHDGSWSYLKLQCLCARLQIGVVKTYSDVNSWPSRSPSSEHPLLPSLRTHFLRSVGRGMEMTLPHILSLEFTKNYSSFNTENYSSLYLPPLVIQSGGSNLGCSARLPSAFRQ